MTQVSKYPLDKDSENILFRKFWHSISSLHNVNEVSIFFSDFLTKTESIMLAKRFAIAVFLLRGKSQKEITNLLHVSYSATGAVSGWIKNAKPQTVATMNRIIKQNKWEELFDKIEEIMDKVPPRYGTNWERVGKEKWKRKMKRSIRRSLR
jgi:uncharacterized protein YerC